MDEATMLRLLKMDLQRQGIIPGEEEYLTQLLRTAKASLMRQGIRPTQDYDWYQLVISTAAWHYRKRISGEAEPKSLRRLRLDLYFSPTKGEG